MPEDLISRAPVTMQQVADAAGLSRAAVSYALRNHPSIPTATRRRVQALADALGYHPNAYVSTLMARLPSRGRGADLAPLCLLSEAGQSENMNRFTFYREVFAGMDAQAGRLGYRVDRFTYGPDALSLNRIGQITRARGIRGVIVAPLPVNEHRLAFSFQGLACSSIGLSLADPELHRVSTHFSQGITLAWHELRALGYRRPGLALPADFIHRTQHGYLAGFLALQMMDAGVSAVPVCIQPCAPFDHEAVLHWVRTYRPDCVLGVQSEILTLLRDTLGVPERIGFAHLDLADRAGVAGLRQPDRELGASAIDQIVGQLHRNETGVPDSPRTMLFKCRWISGSTLRPQAAQTTVTAPLNGGSDAHFASNAAALAFP